MVSNKRRLYVALYTHGGNDPAAMANYHWALIVGPKIEIEGQRGKRYHCRQRLDPITSRTLWEYEEVDIDMMRTAKLLVRVMVAKVVDFDQMERTLRTVELVQHNPQWTCRIWVKDALAALEADGRSLGTRKTNWTMVERTANRYVEHKKDQRRYDGSGNWEDTITPTYNLLEDRETME